MAANSIIPNESKNLDTIFQSFQRTINTLFVSRTKDLVALAKEKGATNQDVAKALKLNPSLITRYYMKGTYDEE